MSSRVRGAVRLGSGLFIIAALATALPPFLRHGEGRTPADDVAAPPDAGQSPAPPQIFAQEALQGFLRHAPEAASRSTSSNAARQGDAAPADSKLLAYAPADGGQLVPDIPAEPTLPDPRTLLGADFEAFGLALAAYKAGDFAAAEQAAAALQSPLALTAAQWAGLRLHPREAGFARLTRFLSEHPNWPAADWLRRRAEEALFGDKHSDKFIAAYFAVERPRTPAGKIALARAKLRADEPLEVAALIKELWREDDFNETLEGVVKKEFSAFLSAADHKSRADRLLYAEKNGAALRAAALAGKDTLDLARARALASKNGASEKTFESLPASAQNDPGLLFARIHMLRRANKISEATALLRNAPREPRAIVDGDAWWTERRLIARKLLDKGQFAEAYDICAQHSARSVSSKVEAEFHAGWIALRFLNDPVKAEAHFDRLSQVAETPIQKSRGAYWLGRAQEARGTPDDVARAQASFAQAASHSTTYYGQLARAKLGAPDAPLRPAPQPAEGDARDESVRVIELLFSSGEKELATPLAADAARRLTSESQLAALAEVAHRRGDAKVTLTLGKLASYRGVALDDAAFPAYGVPRFSALPGSASRSIVYAVARQESAFDPKAVSSAGAMGLMQMIASTARRTAYQTHVGFELKRLIDEPAFNAQLGAAHLGILLGEHKGSYILTFAAYNAGGKRVKEWIDAYGDPRRPEVDPIDWVERIPISETRNYVQRVMENLIVYRAKFADRDIRPPQNELARVQTTTN
jgi:soluble lytic murein transglycosylase